MCKLSEKNQILKNLIAFSISYFLMVSARSSILSIQNVLSHDEKLGITSQMILFAAQVSCSIVIPILILKSIGFKWCLIITETSYIIFIVANMIPSYYTLIPGLYNTMTLRHSMLPVYLFKYFNKF
jgi:hypothetical protein